MDLPTLGILQPRTEKEFNDQLAHASEKSEQEKRMAYPNLLEILGQPTIYKLRLRQIEEYNRLAEAKMRRLENQAGGEGTFSARGA